MRGARTATYAAGTLCAGGTDCRIRRPVFPERDRRDERAGAYGAGERRAGETNPEATSQRLPPCRALDGGAGHWIWSAQSGGAVTGLQRSGGPPGSCTA